MKPTKMAEYINKLCFEWEKSGFALASNKASISNIGDRTTLISWESNNFALKDNQFSSISEYLTLLECSQYTMVMFDGSLLQISYSIKRDSVVGHRLCWYPTPFLIENINEVDDIIYRAHEILTLGGDDILRHLTNPVRTYPIDIRNIYARSPLRIDYAEMPDEKKDEHPDVHLHISHEDCRIPVKGPLSIKDFMFFIVSNFYPQIPLNGVLVNKQPTWGSNDLLTDENKKRYHFNIVT